MTKSQHLRLVLEHTTVLHATLWWPEGSQDVCKVCGKEFRVGERACVVDRRYYAEEAPEGLYVHSLCMQEKCREYGKYEPVKATLVVGENYRRQNLRGMLMARLGRPAVPQS